MSGNRPFEEIKKTWRPPVELSRSTPRDVSLTKTGMAAAALAIMLLLGGIAAGVGLALKTANEKQRHEAVEMQGRESPGVITRLWRTGDKESRYRVAYTFDWDGQTYQAQSDVPRRAWASLKTGDALTIRLVPSKPEWNYPSEWPDRPTSPLVAPAVAAFLVLFAALISHGIGRQKRLIAEGRVAPALVVNRRKQYHTHGGARTVVTYEYLLPDGQMLKGRVNSRKGTETGSVQCAIYLPENPRRSALYPLDLARVAD